MGVILEFHKQPKNSSRWLRNAIAELERRDPFDALTDAEKLVAAMNERWFEEVKDREGRANG